MSNDPETKYYTNPDHGVAYQMIVGGIITESGGLVSDDSVEVTLHEYQQAIEELADIQQASIAAAQEDYETALADREALRASAMTKLIAGTPLTEEEAAILV